MKKLACGLAAMALFGLSAETVTIDPGVGVAVSPAKITGNVNVDVFSGIVTMDPCRVDFKSGIFVESKSGKLCAISGFANLQL